MAQLIGGTIIGGTTIRGTAIVGTARGRALKDGPHWRLVSSAKKPKDSLEKLSPSENPVRPDYLPRSV